jgi:hypothetical protein
MVINLVKDLFLDFNVDSAEETVLGGNQFKSNSSRLIWKAMQMNEENVDEKINQQPLAVSDVELKPMEIRTFILRFIKI